MNIEKKENFLQTDFESMVENLNRISDDLLKAKWYFLATIAAVGIAYQRISDRTYFFISDSTYFPILITSAIANIIFWMIGEYIVSHGFLFRYIQTKVARIEKIAYNQIKSLEELIRNPVKKSKYIKCSFLNLEYVLPDQFLPLYWASLWLIILNTGVAIWLSKLTPNFPIFLLLCFSLFLIWKLLSYHFYKIRQFFTKTVRLQIVPACGKEKNFFHFSLHIFYGIPIGGILSYMTWLLEIKALPWYYWFVLPIFWPVVIAMMAHFQRILDILLDRERKLPLRKEGNKYVVQINRKIVWIYWLLYLVV